MEAKDTVMSSEKILEIIRDNYGAVDEPHPIPVGKIAKAQAEITWPIAFKAGQKDVCTVSVSDIYDTGFKAGMEEEKKGGTNSISYLEGLKAGEILGAKEGYGCGVYNGEAEGVAEGIKIVVEWSNEECPHDIQELSQSGLCTHNDMPEKKCECPLCWQVELKEWGIK